MDNSTRERGSAGEEEKPTDKAEEDGDKSKKKPQPKLRKVVHITFENSTSAAATECPPLTRDEEIALQILLAEFRMVGISTIMYDQPNKYRLLQCNAFDRLNNNHCDSFVVKLTDGQTHLWGACMHVLELSTVIWIFGGCLEVEDGS